MGFFCAMKKQQWQQWLFFAIAGFVLVGAGLSLFGKALSIWQVQGENWFWWGTGALSVVNTGIAFVARAIKHRIYYEKAKD